MENYIWSWSHEGGSNIYSSDSLSRIIETAIDKQFYETQYIKCSSVDSILHIEFREENGLNHRYELQETADAVCKFLEDISFDGERIDKFCIVKAESLLEA